MKRFFTILMLGAIVAFTSCQKDNLSDNLPDGGEVRVSLTAKVPGEMLSRAHGDDGVTRYIMEVYVAGTDELYKRISQSGPVFEVRLVTGKSYDFLFWADKQADDAEPFYTTASLKAVTMVAPYTGNSEARDAFFSNELMNVRINSTPLATTLKRPFAQMNIATGLKDVPAAYQPDAVKISFETLQVYTKFDVSTGFATDNAAAAAWAASAATTGAYSVYAEGNDYKNLATDYLFANAEGHSVNFTMDFYKGTTPITSRAFNSIPLKRNYRTNIVGELLTVGSKITVTIDPVFAEPALSVVDVVEPATQSITDLITQAGKEAKVDPATTSTTTLVMSEPLEARHAGEPTRDIVFEDVVTGDNLKVVTLDLSKGINIPVVIKDENPGTESTNYKGDIVIIVPNNYNVDGGFTFNVPNAHVVIKGTDGAVIKEITASTSGSTLEIEEGVEVSKLTVNKGNVTNRGTIKDIIVAVGEGNVTTINNYGSITGTITVESGSYVLTATASTVAELRAALVNPLLTGVILTADVAWVSSDPANGSSGMQDAFSIGTPAAEGEHYNPRPMDNFVFDGGGHTISGVAYNNVLAVYAHNVTIKDLVIEQTTAQKAIKANAGLSIYRSKGVKLNNVTIRNTGKAGVIVNAATASATGLHTSGNAWGGVEVAKGVQPAGGNKPEFTFDATSTFGEDAQIYISPNTIDDYTVTAPAGWMSGLKYFETANTVAFVYSSTPFTPVAIAPANMVAVKANIPSEPNKIVKVGNYIFTTGSNAYSTVATAMSNVPANGAVLLAAGTYAGAQIPEGITLKGEDGAIINVAAANAITLGKNSTLEGVDVRYSVFTTINPGDNGSGVTIKGCEFSISGVAGSTIAFKFQNSATVEGTTFTGFWKGIVVETPQAGSKIDIKGNTFTNMNPFSFGDFANMGVVSGNTFVRNSSLDVQRVEIRASQAADLTCNTYSYSVASAAFVTSVNNLRDNNIWSGNQSAQKIMNIGMYGGSKLGISADLVVKP